MSKKVKVASGKKLVNFVQCTIVLEDQVQCVHLQYIKKLHSYTMYSTCTCTCVHVYIYIHVHIHCTYTYTVL